MYKSRYKYYILITLINEYDIYTYYLYLININNM